MDKRAVVFIMFGQSNAQGHGANMREDDKIKVPCKNVFGLSRDKNQNFENDRLYWEGYVSNGMNLGQAVDDTYSVSSCLAKLWQTEIDLGNKNNLPDLYIINIAVGAQGVTKEYMWHPEREAKIFVREDGIVDIALFPYALHILSLLKKSMEDMGKSIEILRLHWRGGENDQSVKKEELEATLKGIYDEIFKGFYDALGEKAHTVLHMIFDYDRALDNDPSGKSLKNVYYIDKVFNELAAENDNITLFDVRNYPGYIPDVRGNGMFMEDAVHYTAETNQWVAEEIFKEYKERLSV